MYINVDPKSSTPLYAQIKEQVRLAVATGALRPGDQLPTVSGLAGRLRVNPNTVARSYRELQAEGLLTSQRGSGTFVSARAVALGKKEGRQLIRRMLRQAAALAVSLGLDHDEFDLLLEHALLDAAAAELKRRLS